MNASTTTAVDPITAEIIHHYLESVAAQTITTMVRTSVSPIFNEGHDCSAAIFYYDGEEVSIAAQAESLPPHVYGALTSVEACLEFFHGDLSEGDVLIVADPYYGGTHLADFTVVKPVFYDGQPMFFPAVRAHMVDTGGPIPAGFSLDAREVWNEGFRFSPLKLHEKGELRREVWDMISRNNRLPDMLETDIGAMIGGCRIAEDRIRTLCDRYGLETVRDSVAWTYDYSEKLFRDAISKWPDGVYRAESRIDTDFAGRYDLPIRVQITIEGDSVEVDFEGTAEQSVCIINSVPGNTISYAYAVFTALCPDIPINSGFFRPVSVKLPQGTIVNPNEPAPAAYATICCGADIGDVVMKAAEGFAPERVGTAVCDLMVLWTHGVDRRSGQFFIQYDFYGSPNSAGGVYGVDGWGAYAALFSAFTLASLEMTEVVHPCLYRKAELTTDTAAPGQWRGGPAFQMEREPHNADGPTITQLWVQNLRNPLHGFCGGRTSAGNYATTNFGTDAEEVVTVVKFQHEAREGDRYMYHSAGGSGWGDPLDRDPDAVLTDFLDELVSVEGARHDYGVVIDGTARTIDEAATKAERAALREARADDPNWLALGRQRVLERTGVSAGERAERR